MDCIQAKKLIYDYLDGEMDPRLAGAYIEYVRHCRCCFARYEFELLMKRVMKKYASLVESDGLFKERIFELAEQA